MTRLSSKFGSIRLSLLIAAVLTGCCNFQGSVDESSVTPQDYVLAVDKLSHCSNAEEQMKWARALLDLTWKKKVPGLRYPSLLVLPVDAANLPLRWGEIREWSQVGAFYVGDIPYDGGEAFPTVRIEVLNEDIVGVLRSITIRPDAGRSPQ